MSSFFSSRLLLTIGLLLPPIAHGQANRPNADEAWTRLTERAADQRGNRRGPQESNQAPDWAAIAAEARKFRQDFPDHPQARAAAKVELSARIRHEDSSAELSAEIANAVADYLKDKRNDVRDRLEVKVNFDQAKLNREKHASYGARTAAQAGYARELVQEFPEESDGYGFLLSFGRLSPAEQAKGIGEELLADPRTPVRFRGVAQRLVERPALLNQPLQLPAANAAVAAAAGKTLVVYSWRVEDKGFLSAMKRMAAVKDMAFIGINLDTDQAAARAAARDLPGTQFFDGGDLDGPLASQLKLVLHTSIYLVDGQGIVRDLDAHFSPYDELQRFHASVGGAR